MAEVEKHYGLRAEGCISAPRRRLKPLSRSDGINAFLRLGRAAQGLLPHRKVEPLQRALAGKKAWITGLRAAAIGDARRAAGPRV